MRPLSVLATILFCASAASAQAPGGPLPTGLPGTPDARAVTAGTYAIEPKHTQVTFAVDHMGFSIFRGQLSNAAGSLTLDPAAPNRTALSVTVPVASIHTPSDRLDQELVSADWLNATADPQASFVSTAVTMGPNNTAKVDGKLTLHGVTHAETLLVRFHGVGIDPVAKVQTIGFDGRIAFSRSDFGVTKLLNLVSDHVELTIAGAFVKAG